MKKKRFSPSPSSMCVDEQTKWMKKKSEKEIINHWGNFYHRGFLLFTTTKELIAICGLDLYPYTSTKKNNFQRRSDLKI